MGRDGRLDCPPLSNGSWIPFYRLAADFYPHPAKPGGRVVYVNMLMPALFAQ